MRISIEGNVIEEYKGFYIIQEIINEDVYYVVHDNNDCKRGGALHDVDTCRKWIDVICNERRRK